MVLTAHWRQLTELQMLLYGSLMVINGEPLKELTAHWRLLTENSPNKEILSHSVLTVH